MLARLRSSQFPRFLSHKSLAWNWRLESFKSAGFFWLLCFFFLNNTPLLLKNRPNRSSRRELFLKKGVLEICCKFTGEHSCRSALSINLQSNFIEIALWHECSCKFAALFYKDSKWLSAIDDRCFTRFQICLCIYSVNTQNSRDQVNGFIYCRFPYTGNKELVKLIVGTNLKEAMFV